MPTADCEFYLTFCDTCDTCSVVPRRKLKFALIASPDTVQRLTHGLALCVGPERDFQTVDARLPVQELTRQIALMQPDGILFQFIPEACESLFAFEVPLVVMLADLLIAGATCVNFDDFQIGAAAADHLKTKGLRHLAYVGYSRLHAPERLHGFRAEAGPLLPDRAVLEIEPPTSPTAPSRSTPALDMEWILQLPRPVGLFTAHEGLSHRVVECANRAGLRIPEDISILTAGDSSDCLLTYPQISSVEYSWRRLASTACEALEAMCAGVPPPDEAILIPPAGIRTRQSTDFVASTDPLVQRAIRHIREALAQPLSVPELATALGTNRRTLERAFRRAIDRTPKEMITRMRLQYGRESLVRGNDSIASLSDRCGFHSPEVFSREFKRHFGRAPSQYRRHYAARP